jgi:hypothetical protein
MLSALVLTPSLAAPDPAHAIRVTGYEPQRSGVLGDEQPAHFTIEEIPCIPSRSYRSLCRAWRSHKAHCLLSLVPCAHAPCSRRSPSVTLRVLRHCSTVPRSSDTSPKCSSAYARRASCRRSVCAPRRFRRLTPRRATPRASRQRDTRAFQAAPQPPCRPVVRQRIGTAAESTAVRQHLHRS